MSIETWIDDVAKLAEVDDGKRGRVKSFLVYGRREFPGTVNKFPSAITFPGSFEVYRDADGGGYDLWKGHTEFYLVEGLNYSQLPELLRFAQRIKEAYRIKINLQNGVWLTIDNDAGGIRIPVKLDYGSELGNLGAVVNWVVRDHNNP